MAKIADASRSMDGHEVLSSSIYSNQVVDLTANVHRTERSINWQVVVRINPAPPMDIHRQTYSWSLTLVSVEETTGWWISIAGAVV